MSMVFSNLTNNIPFEGPIKLPSEVMKIVKIFFFYKCLLPKKTLKAIRLAKLKTSSRIENKLGSLSCFYKV